MGNKYTEPHKFKPGSLYYTPDKSSMLKFVAYGQNSLGNPNLLFDHHSGDDIYYKNENGHIGFPYLSCKFIPVKFTYGH